MQQARSEYVPFLSLIGLCPCYMNRRASTAQPPEERRESGYIPPPPASVQETTAFPTRAPAATSQMFTGGHNLRVRTGILMPEVCLL